MYLALIDGKIHTMSGAVAEAVAVSDNRIVKIGTNAEIKSMCESGTQKIDLKGKTVYQGFNDSHLHTIAYGLERNQVDSSQAGSACELIEITRKFIKTSGKKPGEWILGSGWGQNSEFEKSSLTREDLDKISCEHPIYLLRICSPRSLPKSMKMLSLIFKRSLISWKKEDPKFKAVNGG